MNTTSNIKDDACSVSSSSKKLMSCEQDVESKRKRGNDPSKFERRKKLVPLRKATADGFHLALDADNGESPLILVELDKKQWRRLKQNSIYLSGAFSHLPDKAHINKKKIFYNTIEYGEHLLHTKNNITRKNMVMKDEADRLEASIINIQDIKKGMVAIVTDKEDIMNLHTNIISISSNATPDSQSNPLFKGSKKLLLFFIKHDNLKSPENKCFWNSSLFPILQRTKPNICMKQGTNNHFRSQGYISAWGNKAYYGKSSPNSSVSQYVTKTPKKQSRIEEVSEDNDYLESLVANEVELATTRIAKTFPNIRELISPILNAAYMKQINDGDINFNLSKTSKDGLWQSELCVNALTKDFHTEKDPTYTLISVPKQDFDDKSKKKPSPTYFLFNIKENTTIGFKMNQNLSFIFNGAMLTHRQFCQDGYEKECVQNKNSDFYNIACYGNQRLFNHLRHSFRRELGLE